jgi:hypothetical protein
MTIGVGISAVPAIALAHDRDHDGDGWHHRHDNGWHNGWHKHHDRDWDEDREEEEEHEYRGYQQPSYRYGYGQPYGYGYGPWSRDGIRTNGLNGRLNPRHPGLVLACDSGGHHCKWERRASYSYRYPQTRMNPAAFSGGYNQSPYDNGYYGYSPMDNFAPVLGPLLGWQQP